MNSRLVGFCIATGLLLLSRTCPPASASTPAAEPPQTGNVAIVEDESQRIAAALEPLLTQAGYAVTRVKWDELKPDGLPTTRFDLVVLADARRLPASAVATTMAWLRSGGRLIALGAPAFGELLLKGPKGYVTRQQYAQAIYDSLARRPLGILPNAWTRNSNDPKRPGKIETDGQGWKATVDLDGWHTFLQPLARPLAEGHTLLCLRARGDAATPELAVECTEKDGSRWIATVELTTDWRPILLRPADFVFWPDSPVRRGRAGDRLVPANIASIQFGLSRSHTPQCLPGSHTFWFADLATSADPNPGEADVRTADIEGLSPSYKLYPLQGPLTLRTRTGEGKADGIPFEGYAPVPRETGIGFDRHRAYRWIRALDGWDASGRNRGAVAWLTLGENQLPGAIWASIGLADPESLLKEPTAEIFQPVLLEVAKAMTRGCFLLESGSRHFSYHAGEPMELGALVGNSGHRDQSLALSLRVTAAKGQLVFEKSAPLEIRAGQRQETRWTFTPPPDNADQFPYTATVQLHAGGQKIDWIAHRIDAIADHKARPEEFVRVEGSHFKLGGKPWYLLGINYWPNSQGGRATVPYFQREYYNPDQVEQDLAWMEAAGINLLSGIQVPAFDPRTPGAYRDLEDFADRCRRHGMKLFCFLPWGNPMLGADLDAIRQHIDASGLRDHPAVLAWELAWEPIYYSGPAGGQMDFLLDDWNGWIVERYGSLDEAERDWDFQLPRVPSQPQSAALPDPRWCAQHGPWSRAVAAFRQFFSDRVGRAYGELIRDLRRYDPNHLITFRFGACGIPEGVRFAHAHSASVAKHVDFLCPEGYNLQTRGVNKITPADDLRKGGLVTLYYRFLSREKPVVWMEFGYTVNGMHARWKTADVKVAASELAAQRSEYENFYRMFLESGARGAAPWWLPGGFRLGEESDFGILEPDGSQRPACEVLKQALPRFAQVPETSCLAPPQSTGPGTITLDLDAHYADGWNLYSTQYLEAIRAGQMPRVRTEGTGTTSANCPLIAVGDTPLTGHNPPKYLNAEFNTVEVRAGDSPWYETRRDDRLALPRGQSLRCRASVGNIAEASWQVSGTPGESGVVYLACRLEPSGKTLQLPLAAPVPYLGDGEIREFTVPTGADDRTVVLGLCVVRTRADGTQLTIPFGEKRSLTVKLAR